MKSLNKLLVLLILISTTFISSCEKEPEEVLPGVGGTITITEDITINTTWEAKYIYIIEQSIDIKNDALLTIEPGTLIKFKNGGELDISYSSGFGNIKAIGTVDKPIIFTSIADNKTKGDWDGLWFYEGANASELEYCVFEYSAGYNSPNRGAINLKGANNLSIRNCTFKNNSGFGIYGQYGSFSIISGNSFIGCDANDIQLQAHQVENIGTENTFTKEIEVTSGDLEKAGDIVWLNPGTSFIIKNSIDVGSTTGTKLIIKPGNTLKFLNSVELGIAYGSNNGLIEAIGTSTNPITFTSAATYPSKGDWDGIWFYDGSANGSIFEYCNISYGGGYSGSPANMVFKFGEGPNVTLNNCNISNSEGYGIMLQSSSDTNYPTLSNNIFTDNTLGDKNW